MGTPKALLDYHGETFVGRLVRVLQTKCNPVIVVLGYQAATIRPSVPTAAKIVVNPDPSRGQLSSLQTALDSSPAEGSVFFFLPVDSRAVREKPVPMLPAFFEVGEPSTLF